MDEYISREKALSEIMGEYPDAHYPDWYASIIKEIPVADVVEVVRCKDCIRGFEKFMKHERVIECQLFRYDDHRQYKDLMDYCSHGVRKEAD